MPDSSPRDSQVKANDSYVKATTIRPNWKAQNPSQGPSWLSMGRGEAFLQIGPYTPSVGRLENLKNRSKVGRLERLGQIQEFIPHSNTISFKEDNKHIERNEHVPSSLEDQRLAFIEVKASRPSLKPKFIQIQQGDRIRGSYTLFSIEIVPTHSK